MTWRSVLEEVLQVAYDPLDRRGVRWTVVGSAATALQGCRVSPRDLDFLARRPDGVHAFANAMSTYTPPTCPYSREHDKWHSSAELPVSSGPDDYGFTWHFARWHLDGIKVEVAHIAAPEGFPTSADGAGIWEAGSEIWPHVRTVPFAGYRVPVVPLEIQLGTSLSRGLEERVEQIVAVLRVDGYDHELIDRSLSGLQLERFQKLMTGS